MNTSHETAESQLLWLMNDANTHLRHDCYYTADGAVGSIVRNPIPDSAVRLLLEIAWTARAIAEHYGNLPEPKPYPARHMGQEIDARESYHTRRRP